MHHLVAELRAAGARLTSAEVLLVHGEATRAPDGPADMRHCIAAEHPPDPARGNAGHRRSRVRHRLRVALLVDVDDSALWKAEVSAEIVDAIHPPFTGIIY